MTTALLQAVPGVRAPVRRSRDVLIARRLERFPTRHRADVAALAARDSRLADLALSFPALLFALAVPRTGFDPEPSVLAVCHGLPLKHVARLAGVARWLRSLPPEAFAAPIRSLPDDAGFRLQIANCLPRSPKAAAAWLQAVTEAVTWGDDDIAIWVAGEIRGNSDQPAVKGLRAICLWAWFSSHPETAANALADRPWRKDMPLKIAAELASEWVRALELSCAVGPKGLADIWLPNAEQEGYQFVPLATGNAIIDEAVAMQNCLKSYARTISSGRTRLWSLRKDGARICTISIGLQRDFPLIRQIQGPKNAAVNLEVRQVIRRWFFSHDLASLDPKRIWHGDAPLDCKLWQQLMRPYWLAKQRLPRCLPLVPTWEALSV